MEKWKIKTMKVIFFFHTENKWIYLLIECRRNKKNCNLLNCEERKTVSFAKYVIASFGYVNAHTITSRSPPRYLVYLKSKSWNFNLFFVVVWKMSKSRTIRICDEENGISKVLFTLLYMQRLELQFKFRSFIQGEHCQLNVFSKCLITFCLWICLWNVHMYKQYRYRYVLLYD